MKFFIHFFLIFNHPTFSHSPIHHIIYFGSEREKINDSLFLNCKTATGAQIRYSWKMLEPKKDEYDFEMIIEDLIFLKAHGK